MALPLLLALAGVATANGRDVTVFLNNGSPSVKFVVGEVSKMYFDNGSLLVAQAGGNTEFKLSEVSEIRFGEGTPTAINATPSEGNNLRAVVSGSSIQLYGYDTTKPQPMALYSANGSLFKQSKALSSASIDISAVPNGMFILKIGNKTFKIRK